MASLGSKIKSSLSSAANKVTSVKSGIEKSLQNAGSNLAKQTKALSSSLAAAPVKASMPTGGMTKMSSSGYPTSSPGSIQTGPSNAGMSKMSSGGAPYSTSSALQASNSSSPSRTSSGPTNMTPYTNMTSATTGQPALGTIRTTSGSRSSGNGLASAYNALQNALGGGNTGIGNTYASDGAPGVSDPDTYNPGTYKGQAGTNYTSYSPGQGQSLEAQGLMSASAGMGSRVTPEQRTANRDVVSTWDNSAQDRASQVTALQAQQAQMKAARDAMAPAVATDTGMAPAPETDPFVASIQADEDRYGDEEKRLQREIEKLSKPSEDYLRAQREEETLTAEEAGIKDQMNQDLYGIKGQAIPQGFLTGQGARVQDLANVGLDRIAGQKVTLQQKLANEQARRAAALDVVKTNASRASSRFQTAQDRRFDYQSELRKNKRDDEKNAQENRYKTIGDGAQLYDTVTGKIVENSKNYAPRSGGGSTSPSPTSRTNLAAGEAKLRASKGPDGYVDPTVYQTAFNEWPGTTAEFISKFPPKNYVNPANTWLPAVLRPTASAGRTR